MLERLPPSLKVSFLVPITTQARFWRGRKTNHIPFIFSNISTTRQANESQTPVQRLDSEGRWRFGMDRRRRSWEEFMSPQKINPEILRSILVSAGKKLKDTLADLESEDLDDQAVGPRIKEVQKELQKIPNGD